MDIIQQLDLMIQLADKIFDQQGVERATSLFSIISGLTQVKQALLSEREAK